MRLCFDMDGTITEGRFLEPPRTREMYMTLTPYDSDTPKIWNTLSYDHELYIVTARSDYRADEMIKSWLCNHNMNLPTAIITNPVEGRKNPENAIWKADLFQLLKPHLVFDDSPNVFWEACEQDLYIVDNPHWEANQKIKTGTRLRSWKEINEVINNTESYKPPSHS